MKKINLILILILALNNVLIAQVDTNLSKKNALKFVEKEAEFIGGQEAFMTFLQTNLRYPQEAQENDIQGRVILEFVVCEDGSVCNYKVVNNINKSLAEEALRAVKLIPKWKPAEVNNKAVACYFSQPITFMLSEDEPKEKEVEKEE
ncbi:MAG: energy transducer TonB [Chitinophagaceae bacterium]|nr:energy transducer TonB [Chitinophagaceae bacterium]